MPYPNRACGQRDCDQRFEPKTYNQQYCSTQCQQLTAKRRRREGLRLTVCEISGCEKPTRSGTAKWCEMHYGRWRRNGDPHALQPRGRVFANDQGYVVAYVPNHPLADPTGRIYQHRQVLYDEIGQGPHECFWCACTVSWDGTEGAKLHVDHLNGERAENRPENLAASCAGCNMGRGGHRNSTRNAVFLATRRLLARHEVEFKAEVDRCLAELNAVGEVPATEILTNARNSAALIVAA